eukprot:7097400-Pyramimonas_sp.AAC.1
MLAVAWGGAVCGIVHELLNRRDVAVPARRKAHQRRAGLAQWTWKKLQYIDTSPPRRRSAYKVLGRGPRHTRAMHARVLACLEG